MSRKQKRMGPVGCFGQIENIRRQSLASIEGDERNVILTLARMWLTSSSGRICSKDQAAEWAIPKLAKEHATLLEKAKKAYLGDYDDKWEGMETEIIELVNYLKRSIESSLNI